MGFQKNNDCPLVERRHYFVREVVEVLRKIRVPYLKSVDNNADFFTKPLQGDKFFTLQHA